MKKASLLLKVALGMMVLLLANGCRTPKLGGGTRGAVPPPEVRTPRGADYGEEELEIAWPEEAGEEWRSRQPRQHRSAAGKM